MARALPKLEIDVTKSDQIDDAVEIAKKHSCAAIIVSPDLVTAAIIKRGIRQGSFKVIAAVDLPRGELYGKEKFRGFPTEALNADGFEVLLTNKAQPTEVSMEINYLSEFSKNYFGPMSEIRFTMDVGQPGRTPAFINNVLMACKSIPMPTCIRNTHVTKIPPSYSTAEAFTKQLNEYKKICNAPFKLSGNITLETMEKVPAFRFGVSLQQAKDIVAETLKPKVIPILETPPSIPDEDTIGV